MSEDEVFGWTGRERHDGMSVDEFVAGVWIVVPPDGRRTVVLCPCCDRAMRTAHAAKRVADHVYPMPTREPEAS